VDVTVWIVDHVPHDGGHFENLVVFDDMARRNKHSASNVEGRPNRLVAAPCSDPYTCDGPSIAAVEVADVCHVLGRSIAAGRSNADPWQRARWTRTRSGGSTACAPLGAERAAAVRSAVDALPERLRRVMALCELSELSYAEIATALAIPAGTVASRRNAAVARLRRHLDVQELRREPAPARR